MINRRGGEGVPRRPQSVVLGSGNSSNSASSRGLNSSNSKEYTKQLEELVAEAERDVVRAASNHDLLEKDLQHVSGRLEEVRLQSQINGLHAH